MNKPQYPLTEDAKDLARWLVEKWDSGELEQEFAIYISKNQDSAIPTHVIPVQKHIKEELLNIVKEKMPNWKELAKYSLIELKVDEAEYYSRSWGILLLQELRNAVENDFAVSDYFLTMNAIGALVQNSVLVGSPIYGFASNFGDISVTFNQLANQLEATLGQEILEQFSTLQQSIDDLRSATEADKQSKLGKVVSELGRCLDHGANTATVIAALMKFGMLLA